MENIDSAAVTIEMLFACVDAVVFGVILAAYVAFEVWSDSILFLPPRGSV
jgi:hypothetical protein